MTPRRFSFALLLMFTVAVGLIAATGDDEFKPLVSGDDPKQFELAGITPATVTIKDGEVRLSGEPAGFLATKKEYGNYVLRFEWMYERPADLKSDDAFDGNSGLLLHIDGELKVWPKSVEFQLMNKEVGKIYPIGGASFDGKWDGAAAKRATKPVGQWNVEEVVSRDGALTCTLNGVEVTKGKDATPSKGRIGWQSEGVPIRLRKIEIKASE